MDWAGPKVAVVLPHRWQESQRICHKTPETAAEDDNATPLRTCKLWGWIVGMASSSCLLYNPFSSQYVSSITPSCEHLKEGNKFYFRVTIIQATGIPRDFTDVFVQFKCVKGRCRVVRESFASPSLDLLPPSSPLPLLQVSDGQQ